MSYGTIAEVDALMFLEGKGYSCVKLEEIANNNIKAEAVDVNALVPYFITLFVGFCAFMMRRIANVYERIKASSV